MKARRKGTDTWLDIERIQLVGTEVLLPANNVEFENLDNNTPKKSFINWETVRIDAAIAAMQCALSAPVGSKGAILSIKEVTDLSVKLADSLIEELKNRIEE